MNSSFPFYNTVVIVTKKMVTTRKPGETGVLSENVNGAPFEKDGSRLAVERSLPFIPVRAAASKGGFSILRCKGLRACQAAAVVFLSLLSWSL